MQILTLIPARSGSKELKDKNILNFRGKPLLVHSIDQAKKSKYDMKIVVSTDSQLYKEIALEHGAEVPFLRPKEISKDLSTDYEFIKHALDYFDRNDYHPDIILQLRPTQPCRKVDDIDKCLDIFIKNRSKYDSLRTVVEFEKSPYKMYNIENNILKPLYENVGNIKEPYNHCRQILPKTYLHNACIDIFNTDIVKYGTISGKNIYPYIMDKYETVDIDTNEDWTKAEELFV